MNLEERFWSFVDVQSKNDCWEWKRGKTTAGYGEFCPGKKSGLPTTVYAHRFAWSTDHGAIPKGLYICHRCDNPSCCNPGHLFLGTPTDNCRDMIDKRRNAYGERASSSLLTNRQVLDIRNRYAAGGVYQRDLAAEYKVNRVTITDITRGKQWRHVGGPITKRRSCKKT